MPRKMSKAHHAAREGYTRISDDLDYDRPQAVRPLKRGERDFMTILSPSKLKRLTRKGK